jgi:hypothetical protein
MNKSNSVNAGKVKLKYLSILEPTKAPRKATKNICIAIPEYFR